jgi:hypothetical protein
MVCTLQVLHPARNCFNRSIMHAGGKERPFAGNVIFGHVGHPGERCVCMALETHIRRLSAKIKVEIHGHRSDGWGDADGEKYRC